MLVFGGNFTAFSVVTYFARNLDNMLIGWRWGSSAAGPVRQSLSVALAAAGSNQQSDHCRSSPALSRLADDAEGIVRLTFAFWKRLHHGHAYDGFHDVTSDWLVIILLGPKWSGVSRIFALLGIAGFVQPVTNTTGWLFLTQGRTHHMFQWGLVGSSLIVASIAIGLPWGPVGVATSYSIGFVCITTPLMLWFVGRTGPVGARHIYLTVAPIVFASLCGLLAALGLRRFSGIANPVLGILSCLIITVLTTLLVLVVMPAGRRVLDLRNHFSCC